VLLRLDEVTGYNEKPGKNTRYVIHVEQVLAANFAIRVTSAEVPQSQRVEALRRPLARTRQP